MPVTGDALARFIEHARSVDQDYGAELLASLGVPAFQLTNGCLLCPLCGAAFTPDPQIPWPHLIVDGENGGPICEPCAIIHIGGQA